MRAVVYDRYGPPEVQRVEEVDPPIPAANQLLVRVHATTVNRTDCGWVRAKPFFVRYFIGIRRPRRPILGMEFAGTVEAVGSAVTKFAVGDEVFGVTGFGAHAEYVCIGEAGAIAHKPAAIAFDEAAAVCDGACIALSCFEHARLGEGRSILVYGASGSVGTAAVQLASHLGAEVSGVCNAKNVELVRSLGAGVVIDYEREDFAKRGDTYDVVFDAVGKRAFTNCKRALKPGGIYIGTDGLRNLVWWAWTSRFGDKKATLGIAKYRQEDVLFLKELIEKGEYRAVVDRRYPLEDVVEATRYVETGQKTGNVVLTVNGRS